MTPSLDAVTHESFPLQDAERYANCVERVGLTDAVGDFPGPALARCIQGVHDLPLAAAQRVGNRRQRPSLKVKENFQALKEIFQRVYQPGSGDVKSEFAARREGTNRFVM